MNVNVAQEIENKIPNELLSALQNVLQTYLKEKTTRSLNGLSKRCVVSEPTLRRILHGQIKTLPTATTIVDILTTITKEKNIRNISQRYPGPIADYLNSILPQFEDVSTEYNLDLNNELKDSVNYVIYKLSSNSGGLKKHKLLELFGAHGMVKAEVLIQKGYLSFSQDTFYSQVKNFSLNHDTFVKNFKIISDFIKTQNSMDKSNLQSLLANYSEAVSHEAYAEIISVQKKSLKKIRDIMSNENSRGTIPLFLLLAIDTLDTVPAHEF